MKFLLKIVALLLALLSICVGLPSSDRKDADELEKNYAGQISHLLAVNLLKEYRDIDGNHVFSPLGISSMLAILAEGSRGKTYEEFVSALGYPKEKKNLRNSFKEMLKNLQKSDVTISPSFKTWFYIYRNYTAKDEFTQLLRSYYFADVKHIDRSDYDWNEPDTSFSSTTPANNSKDIPDFEDLKKSQPLDATRSEPNDDEESASKFDKVIEDKQYVEVPVIKEEIAKEQILIEDENKNESSDIEDNETIRDFEKIEAFKKDINENDGIPIKYQESNEPEKISIPLKKLEDLEIMQAVESHFVKKRFSGGRTLYGKEDIATALSANSLKAKSTDSPNHTRMLLFNGLYYHGNWAYPFQQLRSSPEDIFFVNKEDTIPVNMMKAQGNFRTAILDDLNSQAIEFPYENKRYSLLVILPNERDGLYELINKLKPDDFEYCAARLVDSLVDVRLPKFNVETTSRSEKVMKKLGLNSLFNEEEADLGDITEDFKLHVDELVQHVNVRVDEGSSSENFLSASGGFRSLVEAEKSILIDHPFLYFVLDSYNNNVIVAGKVSAPDFEENTFF